MTIRAALLSLALTLAPTLASAQAPPVPSPEVRQIMAPTGKLRVALYTGTTTSVRSATDRRGVGYDLGREMARRLNVPFVPIILENNLQVQAKMKAKEADLAFANASPERRADMDFTQTHLTLELGYLAAPKSTIRYLDEVDRPAVRVGVTAGSSSLIALQRDFKNAKVIAAPTFSDGLAMLAAGQLDLFATNKGNLGTMAEKLPGSRLLNARWGVERHAMAIPKGREAALPFARAFVADAVASGKVKAAATRAGLKGMIEENPAP